MIFNKDFVFSDIIGRKIEKLPDLSESIVMGDLDYTWCIGQKSQLRLPFVGGELKKTLEGAPKQVDEYFACSMNENLTSLEGVPKDEEKRKQQNISEASISFMKKFGNGGNGGR